MSAALFLEYATLGGLGLLSLALLLTVIRVFAGPTLPDRVLALDLLTMLGLCYVVVIAIRTGYYLYLDIAIALGLVGFLSTVAFARYILSRKKPGADDVEGPAA